MSLVAILHTGTAPIPTEKLTSVSCVILCVRSCVSEGFALFFVAWIHLCVLL